MVEITKQAWQSWNPKEKKRNKKGECFVLDRKTRQWVQVYWRR